MLRMSAAVGAPETLQCRARRVPCNGEHLYGAALKGVLRWSALVRLFRGAADAR